jgi:hypothetical protein
VSFSSEDWRLDWLDGENHETHFTAEYQDAKGAKETNKKGYFASGLPLDYRDYESKS